MKSRSTYWATIIYNVNIVEWYPILESLVIPCAISPLHDMDDNKPHYHVLFSFDSLKSRKQIQEITDLIGGVGQELVRSIQAYTLYLTHDNSSKHKYDKNDVILLHGFNYDIVVTNENTKYIILREIINFIEDNNIIHFVDIMQYSMLNNEQWFRICVSNSNIIKEYIRSKEYKEKSY